MLKIIKKATVFIYDLFISTFFTIAAHFEMIDYMHLSSGNFLDVGCGTGTPLRKILQQVEKYHQKIVGVDLHPEYCEKAMKIFENNKNVEIYNLDFYKIRQFLSLKFRFILFSFSFMLMPDRQKALEVAKSLLEKNQSSRIAFVMTLNKSKSQFVSWFKSLICKFTTVDFGTVVCEEDFYETLENAKLEVVKKVRLNTGYNLMLKVFPVYYIECRVKR